MRAQVGRGDGVELPYPIDEFSLLEDMYNTVLEASTDVHCNRLLILW
jgi:hypothetical protein